jgi:hypothetical protein
MPDMEDQLRREPTRIEVEGTPYVLPALDTFDLDEAMVMYRYSSLTFDQIFELEGLHPGVVAALLHVAIARSDPALKEREVKEMVLRVNMMSVLEQLAMIADSLPDPTLAEAPQPEPNLPRSSSGPIGSSGESSGSGSEPLPERSSPGSSGLPGSAIPATLDQPTLVP